MTARGFTLFYLGVIFLAVLVFTINHVINSTTSSPLAPSASDNNNLQFSNNPNISPGQSIATPPSASQTAQIRQFKNFPILPPNQLKNKEAVIETNKGKIDFEIYPEATKAASSFIYLAQNHFYDGLSFHRVEPGIVIQGGDPNGDGTGGPGYEFMEDNLFYKDYLRGVVAMAKRANEKPGVGGSQFFIMLSDNPLPPEYVIFGKVISGMEVVDKIKVGDIMRTVTIRSL